MWGNLQDATETCSIPKNLIITGDNHSVSLANIAVYYILQLVAGVLREVELSTDLSMT